MNIYINKIYESFTIYGHVKSHWVKLPMLVCFYNSNVGCSSMRVHLVHSCWISVVALRSRESNVSYSSMRALACSCWISVVALCSCYSNVWCKNVPRQHPLCPIVGLPSGLRVISIVVSSLLFIACWSAIGMIRSSSGHAASKIH